jgi:DNA-directed RNA polymerase specialized sigma24 family protein
MLPIIESLYGLHQTEQLSVKEIAAKLGIPENTLSQKLSRLRAELRRKLGKNF